MRTGCVLTDYIAQAMSEATYEELDDGSFAGRIPPCTGVIAFESTHEACKRELRSTLEDWLVLGLRMRQTIPVLSGIDLNEGSAGYG